MEYENYIRRTIEGASNLFGDGFSAQQQRPVVEQVPPPADEAVAVEQSRQEPSTARRFLGTAGNVLNEIFKASRPGERYYRLNQSIEENEAKRRQREALVAQYGEKVAADPSDYISLANNDRVAGAASRDALLRGLRTVSGLSQQLSSATPEQRAAYYDQIAPALSSGGLSEDQQSFLKNAFVNNDPNLARVVASFEDPELALRRDAQNLSERTLELRRQELENSGVRTAVAQQTAELRAQAADPNTEFLRSAARREGADAAAVTANLPVIEESADRALRRLDGLINDPDLDLIVGLPDIVKLKDGGLGFAPYVIPGTRAAGALNRFNESIGDIQASAYNLVRGGGAITQEERQSISASISTLERATSVRDTQAAVQRLVETVESARRAARERAAPSFNPNNPASSRNPDAARPQASGGAARAQQQELTPEQLSEMTTDEIRAYFRQRRGAQ